MHLVAVYGTLRQGFHNNYLLRDSKPLGVARGQFPSVMFSAGGFPILDISKDFDLPPVVVELYEVSDEVLEKNLDRLEGYPEWYDRTQMWFAPEEGNWVKAWVYHQVVDRHAPVVESNDWKARVS